MIKFLLPLTIVQGDLLIRIYSVFISIYQQTVEPSQINDVTKGKDLFEKFGLSHTFNVSISNIPYNSVSSVNRQGMLL